MGFVTGEIRRHSIKVEFLYFGNMEIIIEAIIVLKIDQNYFTS